MMPTAVVGRGAAARHSYSTGFCVCVWYESSMAASANWHAEAETSGGERERGREGERESEGVRECKEDGFGFGSRYTTGRWTQDSWNFSLENSIGLSEGGLRGDGEDVTDDG